MLRLLNADIFRLLTLAECPAASSSSGVIIVPSYRERGLPLLFTPALSKLWLFEAPLTKVFTSLAALSRYLRSFEAFLARFCCTLKSRSSFSMGRDIESCSVVVSRFVKLHTLSRSSPYNSLLAVS